MDRQLDLSISEIATGMQRLLRVVQKKNSKPLTGS